MSYSHRQSLHDRVFIVTGAARGIGKGIAEALLERGASVLLVDLAGDHLEATAEEFSAAGYPAAQLVIDLREHDAPARIVAGATDRFGSLHGLVNNAMATREPKPFTEITDRDFALDYEVGARATFLLMQAVYPVFVAAGGGAIVNLGSGSGTGGEPGWGAYAGAKEAIRGMSKVAALEWGPHGIRVNVVCPFAESDGVKLWRQFAPEEYEKAVKRVPLQRIGDPRTDVGALVAFLLGDDASFITAQTIHVDGGTGSFR
jgi:NAD(P)-dependent dehydrogenase (short-subunit alcohol dehydrogenase family)